MLWFAREGFSAISMTFAGILVAFNPLSLGYLPILYSEFLFIFLSTTALLLTLKGRKWESNSKWAVIGIIVGLAVATRTAGWPLVAGFVLHLILCRRLLPVVAFSLGLGAGILVIPFFYGWRSNFKWLHRSIVKKYGQSWLGFPGSAVPGAGARLVYALGLGCR